MAGQAIVGDVILEESQAGRSAAQDVTVEDLIGRHSRLVFRISYSILRNHHDAEDATQETFLRVLKYQKKLKRVRNPRTWLARIAWTVALDRRSSLKQLPADAEVEGLEGVADEALGPEEQVAEKQTQALLQRLIAGLPEELRHPLELSTVQELNSAEIAEVMGIPEGSVRTRLMRARNLLKEKLASRLEVRSNG